MSRNNKDKGRIPGPFVPILLSTLDTPAWMALSHGAQCLYIALKRESSMGGNRAYLSTRAAARKLRAGRQKVREWFAELQHYGFIVMLSAGCLGSDGHGKAPHWRLTEKGNTSKHSPEGLFEPPSNDFLKWNGTPFDPKPYRDKRTSVRWDEKQNPGTDVQARVAWTSIPALDRTSIPGGAESGMDVQAIRDDEGGTDVRAISRLTTLGDLRPPRTLASVVLKSSRKHEGATMENVVSLSMVSRSRAFQFWSERILCNERKSWNE
jgi:hypothetical protein